MARFLISWALSLSVSHQATELVKKYWPCGNVFSFRNSDSTVHLDVHSLLLRSLQSVELFHSNHYITSFIPFLANFMALKDVILINFDCQQGLITKFIGWSKIHMHMREVFITWPSSIFVSTFFLVPLHNMFRQGRQVYDNYWQHFGIFRDPRTK